MSCRRLIIVLGDQLDASATVLCTADPTQDAIWMAEVPEESTHVWSAKQRIAVFLSAMRHFAQDLQAQGWTVHYTRIEAADNRGSLEAELTHAVGALQPQQLALTAPGDWRVLQKIRGVAAQTGLALTLEDDSHFYSTVREFAAHARQRKSLRLEYWYREMRRRHRVLMDADAPVGGQWNFDADNRGSFGKAGPIALPAPAFFPPDAITREVIALVNTRFAAHPGSLLQFGWPVTRGQALAALTRFISERLPFFGQYQDAMWMGEPWLYHAHLACALNLKLLHPREAVDAAEKAYRDGHAPLAAAEGFVRQILGWREYVRGIYWTQMPSYGQRNALAADQALPDWFWTGDTDMACLRDAITQTLQWGYAHHIQRLMVTGLYTLLLGVRPEAVHAWYLAVYVDAVEWVELPNTLGMALYADGGLMASKPYVASGKYIQRMGNQCQHCRFDPAQSTGPQACPFTTLYWDFLQRHHTLLTANPRMAMQLKNLERMSAATREAIAAQAAALRTPAAPLSL